MLTGARFFFLTSRLSGFERCCGCAYIAGKMMCIALLPANLVTCALCALIAAFGQELGRRPLCRSSGCDAYATKSVDDLSDRVKIETFLR